MTPVEQLQAAIDRLEELDATRRYVEINGWLAESVTVGANGYEAEDFAPLTSDELIVTLHRTIVAQLAILRAAWSTNDDFEYTRGDYTGRGPLKITPLGIAAVNLARAILGES